MREQVEELRRLLSERSIRKGTFTLASGGTSHYYCDTRVTTLSPRGSFLTGRILFALLARRGAQAVGGLALGATFVSSPVVYASEEAGSPLYGFAVRPQVKGHGEKKTVEESYHPDGRPLLCPGRRVAVVEDVVTRGGSVFKAIDEVRGRRCDLVAVLALVDRRAGGGDRLVAEGLPYQSLFWADSEGELHTNEEVFDE